MGTLYLGPYHEEIGAYRHEGYTARVMPDGSEPGGVGGEYGWSGHVGYRARCECGWAGTTVYPVPDPDPDPLECEQATDEWRHDHIAPLVERARQTTWPQWQRRIAARAALVVEHVAAGRHRSAIDALNGIGEDLAARLRTVEDLTGQTGGHGGGW